MYVKGMYVSGETYIPPYQGMYVCMSKHTDVATMGMYVCMGVVWGNIHT